MKSACYCGKVRMEMDEAFAVRHGVPLCAPECLNRYEAFQELGSELAKSGEAIGKTLNGFNHADRRVDVV